MSQIRVEVGDKAVQGCAKNGENNRNNVQTLHCNVSVNDTCLL